jgi:long-chain acyl-CoA synthetase
VNLLHKLIEHKNNPHNKMAVQYFKKGQLYSLNWEQVYDRVEAIYRALLDQGIQKGDRVALYSNTCKEWGFVDLAVMACGAVTVPLYHSSHPSEVEIILKEVEPKILFVQNETLFKNIQKLDENLLENIKAITFNDFSPQPERLLRLKDFMSSPNNQQTLKEASEKIERDDLVTLIYTSGTSGRPKGVCLTHRQIMSATQDVFPLLGADASDKTLTFLPLSHILGRMELWGHYYCGYTIGYAESIERIKSNLARIQPTVIVAVPRIFEKIFFGIKTQVEISKLKQGLFQQALRIGKKMAELKQAKKTPSLLQSLEAQMAHQLVFSNIQEKLGGRLRFAVSGGAPLDKDIAQFFLACNIPILEGYGLTETTGPVFVNTLFENRPGYVGKQVGDVEIRMDNDGEILLKSDKVMTGYYKNDEANAQAFTEDGFFRTGDIGVLDEDGFLQITDRKKDLIKTAGGKFIAPQKLQNLFSSDPLIQHIHIHGDKKKYIVALITLEEDRVRQLGKQYKLSSEDFGQLTRSSSIQKEARRAIARVNASLASFETIKRFEILDHSFSIESGELTPSLKMKRKVIDEKYKDLIASMY